MYYVTEKCAIRGSLLIQAFAVTGILGQNVQSAYLAYSTALLSATLLKSALAIHFSQCPSSSRDGWDRVNAQIINNLTNSQSGHSLTESRR